jgi:hypothetical protein
VQVPEGKVPEKERAAWQRLQALLRPIPEETGGQAGQRGQETRAEQSQSAIHNPQSAIPKYLLPWDFPDGNLVLTFVRMEGFAPARETVGNGRRAVPPTNPPTEESRSPSPLSPLSPLSSPFLGAGTEAPPLRTGWHGGPPLRMRLLVTAGTRGVLEPCECGEGMRGGLARRATLLKRLSRGTGDEWRVTRDPRLSPFVPPKSEIRNPKSELRLECGDLLGQAGEVEKAEPLLRAWRTMGVDAVVLGPGDLARADPLQVAATAVGLPLLRPTAVAPRPWLRLTWGGRTLGLLALFPLPPGPEALPPW